MKYSIYSDAGNVKLENQDAYILRVAKKQEHILGMAAVCDGVSSVDDGAYASHFIIHGLERMFDEMKTAHVDIKAKLMKLHHELYAYGKRKHQTYGTTLSLFVFLDDAYQYAQVGDSRIYLYQKDLLQLTNDQTLAKQKFDAQTISLSEYRLSNERHILTQCIGISNQLQIVEGQGSWKSKDAILLCSDGIHNLISKRELTHTMKEFLHTENYDGAEALGELALALGEQDNMTALMFTRESQS